MPVSSVGGSPTIISGASSAHTLQAFIELIYIRTANDMLVAHMESLENSLQLTKSAMDLLTRLQNLHNLVVVKEKGTFDPGSYQPGVSVGDYTSAASSFFGTPVRVSANFPSGIAAFQAQMSALKSQISGLIPQLSGITPKLPGGIEDSNSLLAKMRVVLKDINDTHAASGLEGALDWVIDNYNTVTSVGATSAGLIQQNITNAITAGQSLNTTQTESVRNYLYLFEQYYKSASAILQQISQIIQKMADGIAR